MEEIAERTRLVIERAEAEEQLLELNATLEARVEARSRVRFQHDLLYRRMTDNGRNAERRQMGREPTVRFMRRSGAMRTFGRRNFKVAKRLSSILREGHLLDF